MPAKLAFHRRGAQRVEILQLGFQEVGAEEEIGPQLHDQRIGIGDLRERGFQIARLINNAALVRIAARVGLRHTRDSDIQFVDRRNELV